MSQVERERWSAGLQARIHGAERNAGLKVRAPETWIVTDGRPGMENQCLGLAEALGVDPVVHRIAPAAPWRWLPPRLWLRPIAAAGLAAPWPELLIATGRQAVAPAAAIRRASDGRTFVIQIQSPGLDPARFDLVVVPEHDRMRGPNVLATRGALHRVTPARLAEAAERFRAAFAHLPRPLLAVLVGGSNRDYRLAPVDAAAIGVSLARFAKAHGAGLLVTPSRRTGAANEAALRQGLGEAPALIWDGAGENPYFAFLGAADAIVATSDSVSMTSEACATGKPVYVIALPGRSGKFDRFHRGLEQAGITRRFDGSLATWRYAPLDDTQRVADEVRRRLAARFANRAAAP